MREDGKYDLQTLESSALNESLHHCSTVREYSFFFKSYKQIENRPAMKLRGSESWGGGEGHRTIYKITLRPHDGIRTDSV